VLDHSPGVKGVWCEKPYTGYPSTKPVQVNYMRRGDEDHQEVNDCAPGGKLIVYGKDDIHTKCHFEDLAKWWGAELEYRIFDGPCAYVYVRGGAHWWFDNGGVDGGTCFKSMLTNLLDHVDTGTDLWSPHA
jgi:hypothetical protein